LALFYGIAGFGGGYSILAQLRRELVEKRKWLSAEEFLVLAELSKSLPGTAATSLVALLGQRMGGARRGAIAACAFLLPSMLLMIAVGEAYGKMRELSHLSIFFDGMNAAMIGVVGAVTLELGKSALRSKQAVLVAITCALILIFRVMSEPALAAAAILFGVAGGIREVWTQPNSSSNDDRGFFLAGAFASIAAASGTLAALVRIFVPIGVVTFGGGLAMIPAIEHTVVNEQHWLDAKGFADAVAIGQITPGPIAICATFIGFRVAGIAGALVATVAMFGPPIALALVAGRYVDRFHSSPIVRRSLEALAPAVIGMLGAATVSLARASIAGPIEAVLGLASFLVLFRFPVSPLWPLLAAGGIRIAWNFVKR
jgi:chromate transporter